MGFNKVAFGILMVLKYFDQISNIIAVLRVYIKEWEIFMHYKTIKVIKNMFRKQCYYFIVSNLSEKLSGTTWKLQK